jgi:hypothetical protein
MLKNVKDIVKLEEKKFKIQFHRQQGCLKMMKRM